MPVAACAASWREQMNGGQWSPATNEAFMTALGTYGRKAWIEFSVEAVEADILETPAADRDRAGMATAAGASRSRPRSPG